MKPKRSRDTLHGIETAKETHSSMNSLEQRIAALEARLTQVEDQLAFYQAVATYGPAVDSLTNDVAGDLDHDDFKRRLWDLKRGGQTGAGFVSLGHCQRRAAGADAQGHELLRPRSVGHGGLLGSVHGTDSRA